MFLPCDQKNLKFQAIKDHKTALATSSPYTITITHETTEVTTGIEISLFLSSTV